MHFELYPWRFCFTATDTVHFPAGKSANTLRGAFGSILRGLDNAPYACIFEPRSHGTGPSGLADRPRPFVFRAAHLDGQIIKPGDAFYFDLHVFLVREPSLRYFVQAFEEIASAGIGPGRGRTRLESVWQLDARGHQLCPAADPLRLSLSPEPARTVRVRFVTPTELKNDEKTAKKPHFCIVFERIRDRISALRELYGAGPLPIDFRTIGDRAASVRMLDCDIHQIEVERRSSRTGQVHSIGGFVGSAVYAGDLDEFVPYLRAAQWTGVGRQTVWGKGQIAIEIL